MMTQHYCDEKAETCKDLAARCGNTVYGVFWLASAAQWRGLAGYGTAQATAARLMNPKCDATRPGSHPIFSWGRPMAFLAILAVAEEGGEARAQSSSSSTASASAEIIDPASISQRAAGAPISVGPSAAGLVMADLTGDAYEFKTAAGAVASISISPPSVMRRAGGPQRIALAPRVESALALPSGTAVYIPVRLTVPVASDAEAGLYAGDATIIMNLN